MSTVTAVVPVHNHQDWVAEAIQSLLQQTRPPDRIAIVENGSSDNSFAAVVKLMDVVNRKSHNDEVLHDGFIQGVPTWFYSTKSPLGPALARNLAIQTFGDATDIFALLDSDDIYEKEKIEKSLPFFDDPHVGIVYSDYTTFGNGVELREYKEPFSYFGLQRDCIINCDSLVKSKFVLAAGGFDQKMRTCEDYDLWLRMCKNCIAIHIPESLVRIRVGNHSSTAQVPKEVWNANWARIRAKQEGKL